MATEARIDSIAWGALLAWLCSHVGAARLKALLDNEIAVGASLGLLLLCLLVRDEGFRESIATRCKAWPASAFLRNRARPERPALRAMLASRPAVLIGKLSYSLYLYHWLALVVADWSPAKTACYRALVAHVLPLSIGLSYASYRIIERPSLALRKRYGSHAPG